MKTKDKIVVGFVWCLIIFETISYLTLMVPNFFTQNIVGFVLVVPVFCVIVGLLIVSYYKATTCPPGSPTFLINTIYSDELQQIRQSAKVATQKKKARRKQPNKLESVDMQQIKQQTIISYCFKCDVVKEERVHHCSICKKCIMRMDHHCPWVGNCVGKLNHKFFILFLAYATTGLLMVSAFVGIDVFISDYFYVSLLQTKLQRYWFYFAGLTSLMLASSIGFLFVTQMLTSIKNITTLQSFIRGIYQLNPWHKNYWKDNLRQIFGSTNWILPTAPFANIKYYGPGNQLNSVDSL